MDGSRFDQLTRQLAVPGSRRRLLGGLVAGVLGLAGVERAAAACNDPGRACREDANCCSKLCNPRDARGRRRCGCRTVADCPAASACRAVACEAGVCVTTITPDASCDDRNPCTKDDACTADGKCVGTPIVCPAQDQCHAGSCDRATGQCQQIALTGTPCDDGNPCTDDTCQNGVCVGTPKNCDDNNVCTTDACDAGVCVHTPITCPLDQSCDPSAGCVCSSSANCPPGYECFHGGCFLINTDIPPTSTFCFNRCGPSNISGLGGKFVCVDVIGTPCASDADCPLGQACFANLYCIAPC